MSDTEYSEDSIDDDALSEARAEWEASEAETQPHAFIYACELSDIPANGSRGKVIELECDEVALFNLNGALYGISNICPHESSPLLASGRVDKNKLTVTCPLHGWEFEIPTGRYIGGGGCISIYQIQLDGNEVWVSEHPKAMGL